jgi:hypothetical protein
MGRPVNSATLGAVKKVRMPIIPMCFRLTRGPECIVEVVSLEDDRVLHRSTSEWPFRETFVRYARSLAPGSIIQVVGVDRVFIVPGVKKS